MNKSITKGLGLVAALYFTASYQAQVSDSLKEKKIDEVVVIGYGTQKKSNVTGSISSLKASDIEKVPAGRPEQVLQGKTAGVSVITNSGQPGSVASVRVRGITSYSAGNDPLWVVDGIVVDNIGWLNQSDIESIEVLKDGASAAIYGVSAARGVILVTTKKGKKGKISLTYNGSYGIGSAAKKLNLLNATEYATIINEQFTNAGSPAVFANPNAYGEGTDWQDVIFGSGEKNSQEFSISGGSEKSSFYSSFGYFDQTGIVLSDISNYKRLNARLNSVHQPLDFLTIGQTFSYTHSKSQGINTNGEFGGPLSSAINLDPITPIYVDNIANTPWPNDYSNPYIVKDTYGRPYGISHFVNQEMTNPLAFRYTQLGRYGWSDDFVGNIYAELKLLKHFTFKPSLNGKLSYWGDQGFSPLYYLSPTYSNTNFNSLYRTEQKKFEWNIENTLTYKNTWGEHNLTALLGQAAYFYNISSGQSTTYTNLPVNSWQDASFNFNVPQDDRTTSAWDGLQTHKASYFARVIYDYADKYLFTGTIRRDGSSKFGPNMHWGNFPSVSLGWNVYKENFWPENKVINQLKLRGGYGVLGNDAIDDFLFANFLVSGSNYTGSNNVIYTGYAPSTLANPDLHWEETSQLNIAADMKLFRDFSLSVDWFKKKTTDILRRVTIPGYVGVPVAPVKNIGDMENKGVEVDLGYKLNKEDFTLSVNGNFAYLENKVTKLEAGKTFEPGAGFQSMGTVQRIQVDYPYNGFWGYKTNGIFQNAAEIAAYTGANGAIQPNARPGDFKWTDTNNDGKITEDDMVYLGSSIPKYTFGLTLNMTVHNWDVMAFMQGQAGNKLFQGLRRLDVLYANYQTEVLDRWTGEGTSNTYPRLTTNDTNGNFTKMSDFYLQKGDFLRLKVFQVGYSLPESVRESIGAKKIRIYLSAENLFTITKYTGYDPEIAAGDSFGIDRAFYPQSRSLTFGANIQF